MAGSKKKTLKDKTRAKSATKGAKMKKAPQKQAPKPAKKGSAKKAPAKKPPVAKPQAKKSAPVKARPAPVVRPAPPSPAVHVPGARTFANKVRDCVAGTGVWFVTAGSVEHAAIQRRGADGTMVILTDAGATEVVLAGNLFESADEARAARY